MFLRFKSKCAGERCLCDDESRRRSRNCRRPRRPRPLLAAGRARYAKGGSLDAHCSRHRLDNLINDEIGDKER